MVEHVAIVGASLAGFRTAEALRREGFAGRLTLIGAEDAMPYDRPPLSKQFLVDDWDETKLSLARADVDELKIEWRLGLRAESLDTASRSLELSDGSRVEADAIVLATGTQARRLPFGRDLEGVLELRNLVDARKLRAGLRDASRVVVVGAGFIGMEVAASCRQRGLEVAVVEPLEAPLMRGLGSVLGERVARRHRQEGIDFHLGTGVEGFEGEGRVTGVRLSSGHVLPADLVLVGVGAAPAVDWLADTPLEIDNGVLCDATGWTGVEGVYALGDCARWTNTSYPDRPRFEHWTSAVEQSEIVARRILGHEIEEFSPIPYVWTDQFDLRIGIVGDPRPDDEMRICLGSIEEDRFLALFGREGRLVAAVGFKRPRQLNACRRLIARGAGLDEALAELS